MSEETATPTAIAEEPAKDVQIPEEEDIRVYPQTEPEPAEPVAEAEPATTPEVQKEAIPDYLDPVFLKGGRTVEEALKEQARAYREARAEMSRRQNESAEYRKLVDEHILKSIKPAPEAPKPSVFNRDLGLDETQVRDDILRTVAPIVKPIVEEVVKLRDTVKKYEVEDQLSEDHWSVVQSDSFREFAVNNYPKSILQFADSDPETAKFIVESFKKTQRTPEPVATPKPEPRVFSEKVKTPVGAKVFSRRELIKLQQTNPSEYARMAPEITRAYAEGNIRD